MAPRGPRTPHQEIGDRLINVDRFHRLTQFNAQTGCEEWQGPRNNAGYGMMGWRTQDNRNRMMTAHRAAWMIHHNQAIPPGQHVHHRCHNRLCVTGQHLKLGTHDEKMRDMMVDQCHGFQIYRPTHYNRQDWHLHYAQSRKYTEAEIQFGRSASFEDIMAYWGCDWGRAQKIKRYMRSGYHWLPFDRKGTSLKRGRKPLDRRE